MTAVTIETNVESTGAPVLDFYLRYWKQKRGDAAMPVRAHIRPSELKPHLAAATLVEALPGLSDFRFRLVGTAVTHYFFASATGKTFREIYAGADPRVAEEVVRLHRSTIERAAPILARTNIGLVRDHYFPPFDVLYLPLADDNGEGGFVLSAYSFPKEAEDRNAVHRLGAPLPAPPIGAERAIR